MKVQNLVIGAGASGIVLARRIAEEKNEKVLIIEKRNHIAGDCYDYRDAEGILIHKYGPHIFRTNDEKVYHFLSRFTDWFDYQHKVLAYVGGDYYPMPINLDTVNNFLGTHYNSENVLEYFDRVKKNIPVVRNVKDVIESQVGTVFYENFFKNYTQQQWGMAPEDLPPEIVARIPIRSNRDDRYFTVKYQGIPSEGYTAMFMNMLNHPNISYMLNTDYFDISDQIEAEHIYFSGRIDEFYQYKFGKLPYRCVHFKFETIDREQVQPVAVVNYPNENDYTRITEFKHFMRSNSHKTVISKEYPSSEGNPSYPIPTAENQALYQKYVSLSANDKVEFIGRLGTYKYYSMDQTIDAILKMKL
ncbi:MAG: UDP-galactopyranose mutase [Candidatus Limivicinus sp.]